MTTKNKLAGMDTMTTGKSTASFTPGQALTLHNELVSIIVTDPTETVVQYGNKAQRLFRTNDLSSYLDLGFFPSSTRFTRPVDGGMETAYIEHPMTDHYIMEVIGKDGLEPDKSTSMTFAELMTWHMTGPQQPAERTLPGKLYVPKAQMPTVDASIAGLIKDLESEDDDQPFETDLQREVERLRKDLEAMEIRDQAKINDLTRQLREANADLLKQNDLHITELVAKNQQIERLEAKAAILNPAPTCKEYCIRFDISEAEINKLAAEGWQIQHMQFINGGDHRDQLNTVFVRDLPASPAPKVAATDAAIYSAPAVPAYRPPVQSPPMPANQTIVGAPVSRALTNNGPQPGETKRIPTLAQFEARKEANANEIAAILQRGADEQEALRRQFAKQSTHPFGSVQGVSPL